MRNVAACAAKIAITSLEREASFATERGKGLGEKLSDVHFGPCLALRKEAMHKSFGN
jgi:hypothetical protein